MTEERLVGLLFEAGDLVGMAGLRDVENVLNSFGTRLRAARETGDREAVSELVREVLQLYTQGMGGFQDVVLMRAGRVLPEQARFDQLRSRIFEEARETLR